MREFSVDPEFAQLLGLLTDGEHEELEAELKAHGCLSPIIVWKGKDIITDGNNRYEICTKNRIPFRVREMGFRDRDEAKTWIITNQLARRNIPPYRKYKLIRVRDDIKKKERKAEKKKLANLKPFAGLQSKDDSEVSTVDTSVMNDAGELSTRKEIAKEMGVGEGTVARAQYIERKGIEGSVKQETIKALERGETTIGKVYSEIKGNEKRKEAKVENNKNTDASDENNKFLGYVRETSADIKKWKLRTFLDLEEPKVRNEVTTLIWEMRLNLRTIALGLSYAKKWPEYVKMLAAGKISDLKMIELVRKESARKSAAKSLKKENG